MADVLDEMIGEVRRRRRKRRTRRDTPLFVTTFEVYVDYLASGRLQAAVTAALTSTGHHAIQQGTVLGRIPRPEQDLAQTGFFAIALEGVAEPATDRERQVVEDFEREIGPDAEVEAWERNAARQIEEFMQRRGDEGPLDEMDE